MHGDTSIFQLVHARVTAETNQATAEHNRRLDDRIWNNSAVWDVYQVEKYFEAYIATQATEFLSFFEWENNKTLNTPSCLRKRGGPCSEQIASRSEQNSSKSYCGSQKGGVGYNQALRSASEIWVFKFISHSGIKYFSTALTSWNEMLFSVAHKPL